jgi:hypothetical protein
LSVEARKIVGDFDQVVTKGDGAAQALEKVTKALQLGDAKGIRDAGAALDALAVRGKLAGDQIASTLAAALKTEDLARFEVTARAAFDTSEQGARRLKAALDAVALESLRRAGTSVDELRTGFNATATSALNDLDLLKRSLDDLGARGEVAGRALSAAITKALDAATTTRSVQEVISRIEELGRTGRLTGDALAAALDKARSKADSLRDGVNSVDEAFRVLGLRAPAELARVAKASKEAFDRIRADRNVDPRRQATGLRGLRKDRDRPRRQRGRRAAGNPRQGTGAGGHVRQQRQGDRQGPRRSGRRDRTPPGPHA